MTVMIINAVFSDKKEQDILAQPKSLFITSKLLCKALHNNFKKLKQNFELVYFFSDSSEGIKTQIWIGLIANLIFDAIHKKIKEAEQFTTIVAMARTNMIFYVSLISILISRKIEPKDRNLEIVQLDLFG